MLLISLYSCSILDKIWNHRTIQHVIERWYEHLYVGSHSEKRLWSYIKRLASEWMNWFYVLIKKRHIYNMCTFLWFSTSPRGESIFEKFKWPLINLVKRIYNVKLDVAAGDVDHGVGYMHLKLRGRSGGHFSFGNYWYQKEYKSMWPDQLTEEWVKLEVWKLVPRPGRRVYVGRRNQWTKKMEQPVG